MVNVYDTANQLAAQLKNCPEYTEYRRLKEIAMENETQAALIKEYKRLQFQLQVSMAGGGQPDPEEMERFQKLAGVLQLSSDASNFILAELRLQKMLADIYKILGEAVDLDMDMFRS